MKNKSIEYIAIKRENMIRLNDEKEYYKFLSKLRRIIETIFSQIENLGLRFIRAISRRGLAIKIILSIIAFNILQMMKKIWWELRFNILYGDILKNIF